MILGDSHLTSTPEAAASRLAEDKKTLSRMNPGKLNPNWVEQLMGVPVGWTQLPIRVDRLRLLGNGVVPATAAKAWIELSGRFE